jgi:nitrous oxide reductase accessory protein NosL
VFGKKLLFLLFLSFINLFASSQLSEALKQKKIYPMGEKIYHKICKQDINLQKYSTLDELKTDIKKEKLCQQTKDKYFQALTLYLWDVKRVATTKSLPQTIKVTKDEKCPVCGMFVYKYPRWVAQIFYAEKHFSFDGVKDMMKYYSHHKQNISKILVTDYYSQKVIDAREAYYILGSDIYGPMGEELIPFKNRDEAKRFRLDHKGKKILKFDDAIIEEVYKLD